MPTLKIETIIYADAKSCFDLARDIDFHQKSLEHSKERTIKGSANEDKVKEAVKDKNTVVLVLAVGAKADINELDEYEERHMFLADIGITILRVVGVNRIDFLLELHFACK